MKKKSIEHYTLTVNEVINNEKKTITLYDNRKFSNYKGILQALFIPNGSSWARTLGSLPLTIFTGLKQKIEFCFVASNTVHYVDIEYNSDTSIIASTDWNGGGELILYANIITPYI